LVTNAGFTIVADTMGVVAGKRRRRFVMMAVAAVLLGVPCANTLQNGLGDTPPLGW